MQERQEWLLDLTRHLEEIGLNRSNVIDDTISKLIHAGVTEQQLRADGAADILKHINVTIGARKAILLRFRNSVDSSDRKSQNEVRKCTFLPRFVRFFTVPSPF